MNTFPTLYKKTSTGAIQKWTIVVYKQLWHDGESVIGSIETIYGQMDTDKPQRTVDNILSGKNKGKKNETSAYDQAVLEATAKWEKQKKKGYVESIEAAKSDEVDGLIEGGVLPMLAHKFTDHGHKTKYPAFVQPKLDGIRCIAIVKDEKCTLWSRTRKQITSMPHIVKQIEAFGLADGSILDGELYNHEYRNNFETIVSLVRQEEPDQNHSVVQYHIYDYIDPDHSFKERIEWLQMWQSKLEENPNLKLVETFLVISEDEVQVWFEEFRKRGYEGCMVRNANGKYVNKRSYDLLKVKEFDDGEFDILGVEEGRGKLAGHAGAFLCRASNGRTFLAKMSGDTDRLKDYFVNHKLWEGKRLTVKYQGLTGATGVPRFPVGVAIRDYE